MNNNTLGIVRRGEDQKVKTQMTPKSESKQYGSMSYEMVRGMKSMQLEASPITTQSTPRRLRRATEGNNRGEDARM